MSGRRGITAETRERLDRELARLPREVTTAVTWYMEQRGLDEDDLARAMGISPGRAARVLRGSEDLTLRTLAAVCAALGAQMEVSLVPCGKKPEES